MKEKTYLPEEEIQILERLSSIHGEESYVDRINQLKRASSFWNERYLMGGNSGKGSRGKKRRIKWEHIKKLIGTFQSVIDVGCGDLAFWDNRFAKKIMTQSGFNYVGIDYSEVIINKNRDRYQEFKFICTGSNLLVPHLKADVVICFDLLFHLLDEAVFVETIKNLSKYSRNWIVIGTWINSPKQYNTAYQEFRQLENYLEVFHKESFELIEPPIRYGNGINAIYFFQKVMPEEEK